MSLYSKIITSDDNSVNIEFVDHLSDVHDDSDDVHNDSIDDDVVNTGALFERPFW